MRTVGDTIFCYLSTPTVLMIFPHVHHDIPHGTAVGKTESMNQRALGEHS